MDHMNKQEINPKNFVLGIDIGSITSKAVILNGTQILSWAIILSGGNLKAAAAEIIKQVLAKACLSFTDIDYIVATGYGAANVISANESVVDISCNGRGISYLFPSCHTVVDIGGQFTRVLRIDDTGHLLSFVLSEKCAAGSGRILNVIARVLQVSVEDLGELSVKSKNKIDFTTGCAVFNETEAVSRIAEGALKEDIAAGINRTLASKIQSLIERVGFMPDLALVGGGAKNIGLIKAIKEISGYNALIPEEPQIVAALGAALIANNSINQKSAGGN
jgi:(R)-2-hydroxyacyl-CoA dehydratese activating ATPase